MRVVDSCGWLSYLKGDSLAKAYEALLEEDGDLIVPTVVLYEVFKVMCRDGSEQTAREAVARMRQAEVVVLDESLALYAADLSLDLRLSMADAMVYATAQARDALLVTSDVHFAELPGVEYIPEPETE